VRGSTVDVGRRVCLEPLMMIDISQGTLPFGGVKGGVYLREKGEERGFKWRGVALRVKFGAGRNGC